jgi:hypothetical protein
LLNEPFHLLLSALEIFVLNPEFGFERRHPASEDFARSLEGEGLRWTALRPDIVIGRSLGSATNLGNPIGLYGALRRETRTATQFPRAGVL